MEYVCLLNEVLMRQTHSTEKQVSGDKMHNLTLCTLNWLCTTESDDILILVGVIRKYVVISFMKNALPHQQVFNNI